MRGQSAGATHQVLTSPNFQTKKDMKGTEQFQSIIKNYLDKRAQEDELFRAKYEASTRTIEQVITYIINEVQKSGRCGFADEEIFGLAVHAYPN